MKLARPAERWWIAGMIQGLEFLDSVVRMPLLELPVRCVVVPVKGGRVMISPGSKLTDAQLRSAGEVTDLVATSLFHTGGMKAAAAAHPKARLWGPPGVREKHAELKWHGILGEDAWVHEAELSMTTIDGQPGLNERVFLHEKSRTLLVTDLVFNIQNPKGLGSFLIYTLFGTYKRFGMSRLFLNAAKDRAAFDASIRKIAALEFDNLVPSHGEAAVKGAKEKFIEALRQRGLKL